MYEHCHKIRVRYGETDQMGFVYYGNYALFFEVGRVEALRSLGFSYKELEDNGVGLPVIELNVKYMKPARYDDELNIITRIKKRPGTRIIFEHEIRCDDKVLNIASVSLVFVNSETGRPTKIPEELSKTLEPYFSDEPS